MEPIEEICEVVSVGHSDCLKTEKKIDCVDRDDLADFPENETRDFVDIDADLVARCKAELPETTTAFYE